MGDAGAVLIIATMDTKSREILYLGECFKECGTPVVLLDAGIMGESPFPVTITREEVALAGGMTLADVRSLGSEGDALDVMIQGAIKYAKDLYLKGKIKGIIGIGGSMGTTLGTGVMRAFPVGFPKVMVSTMASRNTRSFVGTKDIMMLHSVCDLSGINRITGKILRNGAFAIAGLVKDTAGFSLPEKPLIVLSTLGTTEGCAKMVKQALEDMGKEVVVFHTVGSGGEAMEEFIREENVEALIDLSLHELMDHYFGGDYDAGPERGVAALEKGVPTILVPGNIDFLVTGPLNTAKERFPGRLYHTHNAAITTVRTKKEEMEFIGIKIAGFCSRAKGAVSVVVPVQGFSVWDKKDGPFYDPDGVDAFIKPLKSGLSSNMPLHLLPYHINDPEFARSLLEILYDMMN
ncbi:MAG: UPF0261 family protein [Syntrophus sp. (in: bacteria)]|nr:UPF0261 family protein [Syntrophus sp. (in: bacteria)]